MFHNFHCVGRYEDPSDICRCIIGNAYINCVSCASLFLHGEYTTNAFEPRQSSVLLLASRKCLDHFQTQCLYRFVQVNQEYRLCQGRRHLIVHLSCLKHLMIQRHQDETKVLKLNSSSHLHCRELYARF